jgi:hypothetical protein
LSMNFAASFSHRQHPSIHLKCKIVNTIWQVL